MEKYRPDTLDDVSGHQDILATINKFIDSNVCLKEIVKERMTGTDTLVETATSSPLWSTRHRQNVHHLGSGKANIWQQEYETNGSGAER